MKFYMTFDPFTLTNMENLDEVETFNSLHDIISAIVEKGNRKAVQVYMYHFKKGYKAIANELINQGYNSIAPSQTGTEEQRTKKALGLENNYAGTIQGTLPPKGFLTVATKDDATSLRLRPTTRKTNIKFVNGKKLFGNGTIKQICKSVGEENENRGISTAINLLRAQGFTSDTLSSNAFEDLKRRCFGGFVGFERKFKPLSPEVHDFIMASYQGGLCCYNPKYKGKTLRTGGIELDVNSMYPSIMLDCKLPYGEPVAFEGKFQKPKRGNRVLYFQMVEIARLEKKPNGIACVKNQKKEEYYDKEALNVKLVLNHIDLEMMFDNYIVEGIKYIGGYSFKGVTGMFDEYVNYWRQKKIGAKTPFEKMIAKMMLNSAYGKFATRTDKVSIVPQQNEDGEFYYKRDKSVGQTGVYAPVGAYITSYARQKLLKAIKANWDRFVYSDTDSIYLKGFGKAKGIEIHKTKFGAWKKEFTWTKMYIVGKKQYVAQKSLFNSKDIKLACAGMPLEVAETKIKKFKDFKISDTPIEFQYQTYHVLTGKEIWVDEKYVIKDQQIM